MDFTSALSDEVGVAIVSIIIELVITVCVAAVWYTRLAVACWITLWGGSPRQCMHGRADWSSSSSGNQWQLRSTEVRRLHEQKYAQAVLFASGIANALKICASDIHLFFVWTRYPKQSYNEMEISDFHGVRRNHRTGYHYMGLEYAILHCIRVQSIYLHEHI